MLAFGRTEQSAQSRLGEIVIIEYGLNYYCSKCGMLFNSWFNSCDQRVINGLDVHFFVGQLHVPVIIIVVEVGTPVMHGQELYKAYPVVQLVMLHVMTYQGWYFQQLVQ